MPLTVRVMAGLPNWTDEGDKLVMVGTGLEGPEVMVNVTPFDVPPPGARLTTVTVFVPAIVNELAGMVAVS